MGMGTEIWRWVTLATILVAGGCLCIEGLCVG